MINFNIKEKLNDYERKQRAKNVKKNIKKAFKKVFNKKTMTKVLIVFSSLALIASYILPYIA